jgi:hypothetical protein
MISRRPEDYTIEIGPMGPIGEGRALLLRINRNCPWNHCLFCSVYKGRTFAIREVDEVKRDIDAVRRVSHLLETEINFTEGMEQEGIETLIQSHPEIYGEYPENVAEEHRFALHSLFHIARWMLYGADRVFLQDANGLCMKPRDLTEVLRHLKHSFPTIQTISCYARSKTCDQRSEEELQELKDAGLSWCFVGIESGDDHVLEFMKKGAKKKEHISGGQKIMGAGINMAAFVMPGLAGKNCDLAKKHILGTAEVLNEIKPTEVRIRSLAILKAAPLYRKWESGEFEAPGEDQMVEELKMLVEGIHFNCTLETLQMTNLFAFKGPFSETKKTLFERIESYQSFSDEGRAEVLLDRYLYDGYLDCVKSWGTYDARLNTALEDARMSLEKHSPGALEKVERAIFEIKSKGIP